MYTYILYIYMYITYMDMWIWIYFYIYIYMHANTHINICTCMHTAVLFTVDFICTFNTSFCKWGCVQSTECLQTDGPWSSFAQPVSQKVLCSASILEKLRSSVPELASYLVRLPSLSSPAQIPPQNHSFGGERSQESLPFPGPRSWKYLRV